MLLFSATNGVMPFLIRHIFDDVFTNKNITALKVLPGDHHRHLPGARRRRVRQHLSSPSTSASASSPICAAR